MTSLLHDHVFIFWASITLICVVPVIAHYWWKVRKAEIEAALKQEMIQRGMGPQEIRQVLESSLRGGD